jgi:hypothetical protein
MSTTEATKAAVAAAPGLLRVDPQHLGEALTQQAGGAPVRGSALVPARRVDPHRSRWPGAAKR